MTREQLLILHDNLTYDARSTMAKKNHDYASDSDVFRNFRYFGGLGILVRMSDKLARLRSFEENGEFKVADEKLMDTVQDFINYAILYYAFKNETSPAAPVSSAITGGQSGVFVVPNGQLAKGVGVGQAATFGQFSVAKGPYCENCDNLAEWRLDENNCDTRYLCDKCTIYLSHDQYTSCTRMETL